MCEAWGSCWDTKVTKVATIPSLKINGPMKVQPCVGRLEWVGVGVLYPDAQSIARATGSQLEAEVSGPPAARRRSRSSRGAQASRSCSHLLWNQRQQCLRGPPGAEAPSPLLASSSSWAPVSSFPHLGTLVLSQPCVSQ